MNVNSPAFPRLVDAIAEDGGMAGSDLAAITGVSEATVSKWKSGAIEPPPKAALLLSDLHYVVGRLRAYYTAAEIRAWLYARHPQLSGSRAVVVINQNQSEDVLRVLDRLDADARI